MKEWLNAKTYEYKQATAACLVGRDWISIPDGAEFATLFGKFIAFWKHGAVFFIDSDVEWDFDYGMDCSEYMRLLDDCGAKVIWQRPTQPEDLPFIDDEPRSLNDQYAEIEQVRQQTIEQTLAERGSRYGDFESVAETTRALMRILEDADRFNELSESQYEALHMICSKMARIVNGNPDYSDNWHDIAGYAKLVEDVI